MADDDSLSAARIVLLACELCSSPDFEGLQVLQQRYPKVLGPELCCRILLTFVSGNEHPRQLLPILKQLRGVSSGDALRKATDTSSIEKLNDTDVYRKLRRLYLHQLRSIDSASPGSDDIVARFVIQLAYNIDADTGNLPAVLELVEPFIENNEFLRQWLITTLLPLVRLDYEYYPEGGSGLSLETFHDLGRSEGLGTLLRTARSESGEGKRSIGRDLRGLVGPWMYGERPLKRRKLSQNFRRASITSQGRDPALEDSGWQLVNEWLLNISLEDHGLAARAISSWNGPGDVDLGGYEHRAHLPENGANDLSMRYGQTALATVLATSDTSAEGLQNSWRTLERVANIVKIDLPRWLDVESIPGDCSMLPENIVKSSRTDLSNIHLLEPMNAITWPSAESLSFMGAILTSVRLLMNDLHCDQRWSCRSVMDLCLFSSEQVQRQVLHKTLQSLSRMSRVETDWRRIREIVLWLSRWSLPDSPKVDEIILEQCSGESLLKTLRQRSSMRCLYQNSTRRQSQST